MPQEAWDEFVMGKNTRYGLVPHRRGLYGGTNIDVLEKYGTMYLGSKKIPWLMQIRIKPECRLPEHYTGLAADRRYGEWIIAHINELMSDALDCLVPEVLDWGLTCSSLIAGNAIAYGGEESKCDRWIRRYLEEKKVKIVKDGGEKDSWYIRDRACIENISADANTAVDGLLEGSWDHKTRVGDWSGSPGAYGGAIFSILLGAFSEDPKINAERLGKLRAKALQSDITPTFMKDSPDSANFWIRREVPILLDAYERCQAKGDWEAFRREAEKFEADAQTKNAAETKWFISSVAETTGQLSGLCR